MKYCNAVSFAVTLLGMSGLLFQTSCGSSRPNSEEIYSFTTEELNKFSEELKDKLGLIKVATVVGQKIKLPVRTNKGSTVEYTTTSDNFSIEPSTKYLTLRSRTDIEQEIQYTLKNGNSFSEKQTFKVKIPTGKEVAEYYATQIKLSALMITGSSSEKYSAGNTANKTPALDGDTLTLPLLANEYTSLGLSVVQADGTDLATLVAGEKEIKLAIQLFESDVTHKSNSVTW